MTRSSKHPSPPQGLRLCGQYLAADRFEYGLQRVEGACSEASPHRRSFLAACRSAKFDSCEIADLPLDTAMPKVVQVNMHPTQYTTSGRLRKRRTQVAQWTQDNRATSSYACALGVGQDTAIGLLCGLLQRWCDAESVGRLLALPILGGFHDRYVRV